MSWSIEKQRNSTKKGKKQICSKMPITNEREIGMLAECVCGHEVQIIGMTVCPNCKWILYISDNGDHEYGPIVRAPRGIDAKNINMGNLKNSAPKRIRWITEAEWLAQNQAG